MFKSHAWVANILTALATGGCVESPQALAAASPAPSEALDAVVRVRTDPAHGRRWELAWGAVFVYDDAGDELLRRIPLTGASLSDTPSTCRPDLLVSRSGEVIVSSNAQPTLWRIDADIAAVRRYDVALDSDGDKDFGFSALAWSSDEQVLYAASAIMGTLWRIDLDRAAATKIELTAPIRGVCGLVAATGADGTRQLIAAFGNGAAPRQIALSPDLATGVVSGAGERSLALRR
jgi:hypothetical protein